MKLKQWKWWQTYYTLYIKMSFNYK